jgi:Transposase
MPDVSWVSLNVKSTPTERGIMNMETTEVMPQVETIVPEPEVKPWFTREEKDAIAKETLERMAAGETLKAVADSKNMRQITLTNWVRKYKGLRKGQHLSESNENTSLEAKMKAVKEIDELRASGMTADKACKVIGLRYQQYIYYKKWRGARKNKRAKRAIGRPVQARIIQTEAPKQDFNKSVMAERDALRKLVVKQALDIQALVEELGR